MSNGATGSGECREPEGSVPLPTSAECPFGRLYCKVFARTGDLSLAGDGRRTTKKATVVNDIGRKGLDRSNSMVAAVLLVVSQMVAKFVIMAATSSIEKRSLLMC